LGETYEVTLAVEWEDALGDVLVVASAVEWEDALGDMAYDLTWPTNLSPPLFVCNVHEHSTSARTWPPSCCSSIWCKYLHTNRSDCIVTCRGMLCGLVLTHSFLLCIIDECYRSFICPFYHNRDDQCVTAFKSPTRNKQAMFDFAVTDPLTGIAASIVAMYLGPGIGVSSIQHFQTIWSIFSITSRNIEAEHTWWWTHRVKLGPRHADSSRCCRGNKGYCKHQHSFTSGCYRGIH
jgi:hypothetical protein